MFWHNNGQVTLFSLRARETTRTRRTRSSITLKIIHSFIQSIIIINSNHHNNQWSIKCKISQRMKQVTEKLKIYTSIDQLSAMHTFQHCTDAKITWNTPSQVFMYMLPSAGCLRNASSISRLSGVSPKFKENRGRRWNNVEISLHLQQRAVLFLPSHPEARRKIDFSKCMRFVVLVSDSIQPKTHF